MDATRLFGSQLRRLENPERILRVAETLRSLHNDRRFFCGKFCLPTDRLSARQQLALNQPCMPVIRRRAHPSRQHDSFSPFFTLRPGDWQAAIFRHRMPIQPPMAKQPSAHRRIPPHFQSTDLRLDQNLAPGGHLCRGSYASYTNRASMGRFHNRRETSFCRDDEKHGWFRTRCLSPQRGE